MYFDCLLTRLWRHKFLKLTLYEAVFLHDQKVKIKIYISWERKELLSWNKKHFSSFLIIFCRILSQTWQCAFNEMKVIIMTTQISIFLYHTFEWMFGTAECTLLCGTQLTCITPFLFTYVVRSSRALHLIFSHMWYAAPVHYTSSFHISELLALVFWKFSLRSSRKN